MTVTSLGAQTYYGSNGYVGLTCTNAAAAGSIVVVAVNDSNTSITATTVTDSKSNTYTLATAITPTSQLNVQLFYSTLTTGLTTSDVITYHCATGYTANEQDICAANISNCTAIETATTATAGTFSSTYSVTGAGSASVTNEVYIGYLIESSGTPGAASGWTTLAAPSTSQVFDYQVNSGTSALTFNGTVASSWWGAAIVSFKPSAGGTTFLLSGCTTIFM